MIFRQEFEKSKKRTKSNISSKIDQFDLPARVQKVNKIQYIFIKIDHFDLSWRGRKREKLVKIRLLALILHNQFCEMVSWHCEREQPYKPAWGPALLHLKLSGPELGFLSKAGLNFTVKSLIYIVKIGLFNLIIVKIWLLTQKMELFTLQIRLILR